MRMIKRLDSKGSYLDQQVCNRWELSRVTEKPATHYCLIGIILLILPPQTHSCGKSYYICYFLFITERKILDRTSRRQVVGMQAFFTGRHTLFFDRWSTLQAWWGATINNFPKQPAAGRLEPVPAMLLDLAPQPTALVPRIMRLPSNYSAAHCKGRWTRFLLNFTLSCSSLMSIIPSLHSVPWPPGHYQNNMNKGDQRCGFLLACNTFITAKLSASKVAGTAAWRGFNRTLFSYHAEGLAR